MQLVSFALLPAAALAANFVADAGAPQSPPTYTDQSMASTVATVVTYGTSSSVAPIYPTSSPAGQSYPTSTPSYPISSPLPITPGGPIINGTMASGGGGGGGYPTSAAGNLSTTGGGQHPSTSVVVATITGANGQQSTQTSVMVITPSGAAGGPAPSAQGSSGPQSGDGFRVQGGAAAAMAVFGGFLAFML